MPAEDFKVDLRDIRFVLFDQIPFENLKAIDRYKDLSQEEVNILLDEAVKICRNEFATLNRQGDREGARIKDGKVIMPEGFKKAYETYCENGWMSAFAGTEVGGMGMPATVGVATGELFIGANGAIMVSAGLTRTVAHFVEQFGTEEMKKTYLHKLYSGKWQGTMVLTEPQAGTAVGDIKTMARKNGDHYLVTGNKIFISAADSDMTDNVIHLVLARTPGGPKGFKGISLFLIPKFLPDADGNPGLFNDVSIGGIEHKMGLKASPTCMVNFGENESCKGFIIGEE